MPAGFCCTAGEGKAGEQEEDGEREEEEEEGGFPHERPHQELQLSSLSRPGLQPIMARQRFFFRDLQ